MRVFTAVVRKASFGGAAAELGTSPAYVSKRIRLLEQDLQVKLLHRTTRRVAVTEEGERVFHWAQRILDDMEQLMQEVAVTRSEPRGLLRVSSSFGFGRQIVAPALSRLVEQHPGLQVRLEVFDRLVDVAGEGFDLDVRVGDEIAPHLIARRLADNHRVLCASPDYLARRGTPTHPDDLAAHDGIARRSIRTGRLQTLTLRDDAGTVAPYDPRAVAVLDDPEAMAHAAAAGLGIALLPAPHAGPLLADGRLVRILPGWYAETGPLFLYYSNRRLLPAKTRVFVDFVVERFREQGLAAHFAG